jgi:hypothetical protein
MTPLASIFAKQSTLPKAKQTLQDTAEVFGLISDAHCFEVSAVCNHINDAIDHPDFWQDAQSMASDMFLPSPITWLECKNGSGCEAFMIEDLGGGVFNVSVAFDDLERGSIPLEEFRIRGILEHSERIEITTRRFENIVSQEYKKGFELSHKTIDKKLSLREQSKRLDKLSIIIHSQVNQLNEHVSTIKSGIKYISPDVVKMRIAFIIFALSLINTPGIVGMKQHKAHKGLVKQLSNVGKYPLRGWSEIVLKHHTVYDGGDYQTGATFHKCLHFVRSHLRRLSGGKTIIIPAHWRGDPALGIKQSRYRVAA